MGHWERFWQAVVTSRRVTIVALVALVTLVISSAEAPGREASTPLSAGGGHDVLLVKASGSGRIFLGGNHVEGPWTLAYDHGRLTVNGFTLRPAPPAPPPSPARRAESEFLRNAGALMDSLNRSSLDLEARKRRFTHFLESSDLGVQVRVNAQAVEIISPARLSMTFNLVPKFVIVDPDALPSGKDSRMVRLSRLKSYLERGSVVFIDRTTTIVYGRQGGTREVTAAIERLKQGASLDSLDLHWLDLGVRRQLLRPLALDKIW